MRSLRQDQVIELSGDMLEPLGREIEVRLAAAEGSRLRSLSWRIRSTIRDIRFEVEMISDPLRGHERRWRDHRRDVE